MRVAYTAATGKLPPGENPPAALRFALRLDKDGTVSYTHLTLPTTPYV